MQPHADDPRVLHVAPPLRCGFVYLPPDRHVCGELAAWQRTTSDREHVGYFCDQHRLPADVPIAGEHVFRRVRLTLHVYLSGVTRAEALALAEAVELVEKTIRSIGGVSDVIQSGSEIGRGTFQAPPPRKRPYVRRQG